MRGYVLDVPALTDVATGRSVYARALIVTAVHQVIPLAIPASAYALAWAQLSASGRESLTAVVRQGVVVQEQLDVPAAAAVGELLADVHATGSVDLAAAHVARVGVDRGWRVLTDRGPTLRQLAPDLDVIPLA